jgi:hypothetical protein
LVTFEIGNPVRVNARWDRSGVRAGECARKQQFGVDRSGAFGSG